MRASLYWWPDYPLPVMPSTNEETQLPQEQMPQKPRSPSLPKLSRKAKRRSRLFALRPKSSTDS